MQFLRRLFLSPVRNEKAREKTFYATLDRQRKKVAYRRVGILGKKRTFISCVELDSKNIAFIVNLKKGLSVTRPQRGYRCGEQIPIRTRCCGYNETTTLAASYSNIRHG